MLVIDGVPLRRPPGSADAHARFARAPARDRRLPIGATHPPGLLIRACDPCTSGAPQFLDLRVIDGGRKERFG